MQSELFMLISTSVILLVIYSISYCFIELMVKIKKICDEMKERMDLFDSFHTEKKIKKDLYALEKYVSLLESRISQLEKNKTD